MLNRYIIISFIIFATLSCKKDKTVEYEITGTVTDSFLNASVSGATVLLEVNELSSGSFSNTFTTVETTTTNASGKYTLKFDRRNATAYRITVSKDNYFESEEEINPDDLDEETANLSDYNLTAKGWVRVNIKNVNPHDVFDVVTYQMTNSLVCASGCCGGGTMDLYGDTVDTTFVCLNNGNAIVDVNGFYTKDNTSASVTQNIVIVPFDTMDVYVHY